MATTYYLTHAAEILSPTGLTGDFVEVLEGEVRDYGGNVLFSGSADECAAKAQEFRVPARLAPTRWRHVAGGACGCDHQWSPIEPKH